MKKTTIIAFVAFALIIGGFWWAASPSASDPDVISQNGLHWHPVLTIFIKGVPQSIPANIGLGGPVHNPVHTHDEDAAQGVIHLEFGSVVRKQDLVLGKFFDAWQKDIRSFGSNMTMTVNGAPSTEYENYVMRDGDKIELRYE